MDEAARGEWLAVAWEAVGHLPSDLLAIGAAHARQVADHPSRIVPAITAATADLMAQRRRHQAEDREREGRNQPKLEQRRCTPMQAEEILRESGLLNAVRAA